MSNRIKKQHLITCVIIASLWSLTYYMGVTFHLPYLLVFNLSSNPWQPINSETFPESRVRTIDFTDSYHGWIGGERGLIMATEDGGITWQKQQSGTNQTIRVLDFFNNQIGVAISDWHHHTLVTQNGGTLWEIPDSPKYNHSVYGMVNSSLLDVVTCDEYTVYAVGTGGRIFSLDIPNSTWTLIAETSYTLFQIDMVNTTHGWATTGSGSGIILRTEDGWQTYEEIESGFSKGIRGIFFWDVSTGWVVGAENTILGTTDGGKSWWVQYKNRPLIQIGVGVSLHDVFFVSKSKGWAVGSYGIHYTENGGKSWFCLPNTSGRYCIAFVNETHGWAIDHNKELSRMTTVGGSLGLSENLLNTIFSGVLLGVISISVLIAYGLLHVYRKQDTNTGGI